MDCKDIKEVKNREVSDIRMYHFSWNYGMQYYREVAKEVTVCFGILRVCILHMFIGKHCLMFASLKF